jgi:DNA repair protein RadC
VSAAALIREFGSLPAVLAAPRRLQRKVVNDAGGIRGIAWFRRTMMHVLRSEIRQMPIVGTGTALLDYLHADMAHAPHERVRVLYLNVGDRLIRDEILSEGTIDEAPIYIRRVIVRALELGAASLIVVHNHPSGDPKASSSDIALTHQLIDAGRSLGIAIYDHLIISDEGYVSLRGEGLMGPR